MSIIITNNDMNNSKFMQFHNEINYTNKISILQMIKDEIEKTFYKNVIDEDDLQQLIVRYDIYEKLKIYNLNDFNLNASNINSTNVKISNYINDVTNKFIKTMITH